MCWRCCRDLMVPQDLGELGLDRQSGQDAIEKDVSKKKAAQGFIAGMGRPEYARQEKNQ